MAGNERCKPDMVLRIAERFGAEAAEEWRERKRLVREKKQAKWERHLEKRILKQSRDGERRTAEKHNNEKEVEFCADTGPWLLVCRDTAGASDEQDFDLVDSAEWEPIQREMAELSITSRTVVEEHLDEQGDVKMS